MTDGLVSDVVAIERMKFPVFAAGLSATVVQPLAAGREPEGAVNVPIRVGGVIVSPGDLVMADDDGVLIATPEQAREYLLYCQVFEEWGDIRPQPAGRRKASFGHRQGAQGVRAARLREGPDLACPGGGTLATITTVTGDLDASKLGATSVHEHVLHDLTFYHHALFEYPLEPAEAALAEAKLTIDKLAVSKRNQFLIKDALRLDEEDVAVSELRDFKAQGGDCIVDVTVPGMGRDVEALRRIAEKAEINLVTATGWYVSISHPPYVKKRAPTSLRPSWWRS